METVTAQISKLNPFAGSKKPVQDSEDVGELIDAQTVAGGGHAGRQSHLIRHHLRASHALRSFLVQEGVLSQEQAGIDGVDGVEHMTDDVQSLLIKPHAQVPPELLDRSHPLPNYFVSSSHNTYLLAGQLYGNASAEAYRTALRTGSRCVEIDAWDSDLKEEPKVTHGYTLTSSITFRSVCEMIRDVIDAEIADATNEPGHQVAPVFLSLENHCDAFGQQRLVDIMTQTFGHRLLSKEIRDKGTREQQGSGEHVTLAELGSKIVVIVEYYIPAQLNSDGTNAATEEVEEEEEDLNVAELQARREYEEKRRQTATTIIPALADLGVYAQSIKPTGTSWYETGVLANAPHHPLLNVSETGLAAHMPKYDKGITLHNSEHLMRVYPKGSRISSMNLQPVPFWGVGAQICALNWQTFGASMQLNEALFSGTDGYVLKPESLRLGSTTAPSSCKKRLRLHAAGASDVPLPTGRQPDGIKPYLTCTLVHPDDLHNQPPKKKTQHYRQHKLGALHGHDNPPATDPIWDEVLEWEYRDDDLTFLRLLIKSDDAFARNPIVAVTAVRLLYVQPGWRFIRMLDLKGRETTCSLLVKFEIENVE